MCIWDAHKSYPIKCDYQNLSSQRLRLRERDEGGWCYSTHFSGVHPFSFSLYETNWKRSKRSSFAREMKNKNSHMLRNVLHSRSFGAVLDFSQSGKKCRKDYCLIFQAFLTSSNVHLKIKGMTINHQIIFNGDSSALRFLRLIILNMRFDGVCLNFPTLENITF